MSEICAGIAGNKPHIADGISQASPIVLLSAHLGMPTVYLLSCISCSLSLAFARQRKYCGELSMQWTGEVAQKRRALRPTHSGMWYICMEYSTHVMTHVMGGSWSPPVGHAATWVVHLSYP